MVLRLSEYEPTNEAGKRLVQWLQEFKFFSGKKVEVVFDDPERSEFAIYTDRCIYHISARLPQAGDSRGFGYLGCTVAMRKARPGETWARGNDLPDGSFCRETLTEILGAILFYEAREVVESKPSIEADEEDLEAGGE